MFFNTQITNLLKTTENVAKEFKILVQKTENALTENNHCYVKFLYKQRIFEHLLLQNQYFTSRENYLIALMNILEEIPDEFLFLNLTKVNITISSLFLGFYKCLFNFISSWFLC